MKSILLISTVLLCAQSTAIFSWTYRKTTNGGGSGYSESMVQRTGKDNRNTIIKASGVGYESATTITNAMEQTAMNYALRKIADGILKGTWKDKINKTTVSWVATDKTGRNSTIEIVGNGEVIPVNIKE